MNTHSGQEERHRFRVTFATLQPVSIALHCIQNPECTESTMTTYEAQATLFKVLRHPARLAILDILREGEACVCHIEAALGFRQAYISQQLMVLRAAGLVHDRRDGLNIYYHVIEPRVLAVMDAASGHPHHNESAHPPVARLVNCPCPHCQPETLEVAC